jgi:hypothetical protein
MGVDWHQAVDWHASQRPNVDWQSSQRSSVDWQASKQAEKQAHPQKDRCHLLRQPSQHSSQPSQPSQSPIEEEDASVFCGVEATTGDSFHGGPPAPALPAAGSDIDDSYHSGKGVLAWGAHLSSVEVELNTMDDSVHDGKGHSVEGRSRTVSLASVEDITQSATGMLDSVHSMVATATRAAATAAMSDFVNCSAERVYSTHETSAEASI